ncbi:type I-E CRISPR-associated protein Cse1/CasA [Salana multivorans]
MTDGAGYDLVAEPWIRVLDVDGVTRELSLLEAIEQAPAITRLAGELPTQDAAMLRLLLAVVQRALDPYVPPNVDGVATIITALRGQWPETLVPAVRSYLDQHRERFDLFHPATPFFQVPGMRTAKDEVSELSKLIADMPAGRPYLTMRSARAAARVEPGEAARWLVHLQAYDPSGIKTGVVGHPRAKGGKVYPEGVGWTGQLGLIHLVGTTLAETLLLNLWAVVLADDARDADLPPWERPPQTLEPSPDLLSRPAGPVDAYTWQPRRVLLRGDASGVTGVLVTYGDRFLLQERQDLVGKEPMTLWRHSKPQTAKYRRDIQMTRKHQPGFALWRGIEAVLPGAPVVPTKGDPLPASSRLVEHAERLAEAEALTDGLIHYRSVGMEYGAQESVVDDILEDSLDLPAVILRPEQHELRQLAIRGVESAKKGVGALAELARGLARVSGAGRDEAAGPGDRAYETGYSALDRPYREWLRRDLAVATDDPLLAEQVWHQQARRVLTDIAGELVVGVPDKAWRGSGPNGQREDVGAVWCRFERMLRAAFPRAYPPSETTEVSSQEQRP